MQRGVQLPTSYSRRRGVYSFDVQVDQNADRYVAKVTNMVRRESGNMTSVDPKLHDEYGRAAEEAFSKLDAAVEEWVKDQPLTEGAHSPRC
jgi:hypothetical protein